MHLSNFTQRFSEFSNVVDFIFYFVLWFLYQFNEGLITLSHSVFQLNNLFPYFETNVFIIKHFVFSSGWSGVWLASFSVLCVLWQHGRAEVLDGAVRQGVPRRHLVDVGIEGHQHWHSNRFVERHFWVSDDGENEFSETTKLDQLWVMFYN